MGRKESETVSREYNFTQHELKRKLEIEGDIEGFTLFRGSSLEEEKSGDGKDKAIWTIRTKEKLV